MREVLAALGHEFYFAETGNFIARFDDDLLQRQRQIHNAVASMRPPPGGFEFAGGVVGVSAGQWKTHVAPAVKIYRRPTMGVVAVPIVLGAGRCPDLALR